MKQKFWTVQLPLALLICATVLAISSWQNNPGTPQGKITDTIPDANKKPRNIDEAIEQLEKGKAEMDRSMKDIDWTKIEKEIRESLKNIDMDKIKMEIDQSMKDIDMNKIQVEVQKALKEVNLEKIEAEVMKGLSEADGAKIKAEVMKSLDDVDMQKIKSEIDASLTKVDMEKIKAEIDKIKTVDMEKIREELSKVKPEIERSLAGAKVTMENAKKELNGCKNLIDGLEKDGLINKKENYTIEYKNGQLTINGRKQPADLVKKYNEFLKDRKDFTIKKDGDDFDIDRD